MTVTSWFRRLRAIKKRKWDIHDLSFNVYVEHGNWDSKVRKYYWQTSNLIYQKKEITRKVTLMLNELVSKQSKKRDSYKFADDKNTEIWYQMLHSTCMWLIHVCLFLCMFQVEVQ